MVFYNFKVDKLIQTYLTKSLKQPFYSTNGWFYDYRGLHLFSANKTPILFITDSLKTHNLSFESDLIFKLSSLFSIDNMEAENHLTQFLQNNLEITEGWYKTIKKICIY